MNQLPLVSVVLPVFNGERYLGQTIESVLAQTYTHVEVLVIDDGSQDETPRVARRYGERVRYIRQPHGGASKARNHGLRLSQGTYIAMQDADDLWDKDKLAVQVEFLEGHPGIGLVHCHCDGIDEEGRVFIHWTNSDRREPLYRLFMQGHAVGVFSAMFSRELLQRTGLFDEDFAKAGLEDIDFWNRLSEVTTFHCLPRALVQHRVHQHSSCRTLERTSVPLEHRDLMIRKLLARYANDPVRRRFLEREYVGYKSDLGKLLMKQGLVGQGRRALWEAIVLNLRGPKDAARLGRAFLRLVRTIVPGRNG
jgi:glycosyltransferase involved in cell wall biosynthesis